MWRYLSKEIFIVDVVILLWLSVKKWLIVTSAVSKIEKLKISFFNDVKDHVMLFIGDSLLHCNVKFFLVFSMMKICYCLRGLRYEGNWKLNKNFTFPILTFKLLLKNVPHKILLLNLTSCHSAFMDSISSNRK